MQKKGEITEFNRPLICDLYFSRKFIRNCIPNNLFTNTLEIKLLKIHSNYTCDQMEIGGDLKNCKYCYKEKACAVSLGDFAHFIITLGTELEFLRFYVISLPIAFPWEKTEEGYEYWEEVWTDINETYEKERKKDENSIEDEERRAC